MGDSGVTPCATRHPTRSRAAGLCRKGQWRFVSVCRGAVLGRSGPTRGRDGQVRSNLRLLTALLLVVGHTSWRVRAVFARVSAR